MWYLWTDQFGRTAAGGPPQTVDQLRQLTALLHCRDVLVVASGADDAQGDAVAPLVSSVAQVRASQQAGG